MARVSQVRRVLCVDEGSMYQYSAAKPVQSGLRGREGKDGEKGARFRIAG